MKNFAAQLGKRQIMYSPSKGKRCRNSIADPGVDVLKILDRHIELVSLLRPVQQRFVAGEMSHAPPVEGPLGIALLQPICCHTHFRISSGSDFSRR